jgi:hypothetical protein
MPFIANNNNLPEYPCDICGDAVVAGEKVSVTDAGLTVEHTTCTRAWFGRNFGRETLR